MTPGYLEEMFTYSTAEYSLRSTDAQNYYYQKQGLKYLKSHFNILDPKFGTVSPYTYGIASH